MNAALFRETLVGDVGLIGLLLLVGVLLRATLRPLQWLMLPAPVIAGLLGFLLGPNVLGAAASANHWMIGSWQVSGLPFSPYVGSYTTILIAVVFSCMALSQEFGISKMTRSLGGFAGYGVLMSAGQVLVGMLLALFVLGPVFSEPASMGLILFASWSGGFGTSAAMGDVFAANGQPEVTSVAFTSATVGMLSGIVGGVILARIGASRGQVAAFDTSEALPRSLRTGVLDDEERRPFGHHTMSGSSIETLSLHVALVGTIVGLGYVIQSTSADWLNAFALPLFTTAFLVGILVRWIFKRTRAIRVVDEQTTKAISGAASDVLIVCGMVSIEPSFVSAHLASLVLIFVLGLAFCLFLGLVVAPRFLQDHWFEKQLFTWGWATGSVATGIALLRIVDPELESGTVEDFGYAYIPLIPIEGAAVAIAPLLVVAGASWSVALIWGVIALAGFAVLARSRRPARA
ncbi:sodium/glutamate symporter [Nigerium massiliense]|uniref:sodium/glutamate symporter n=1 Tax=Nigerium massiliense TaxID=1522317 RepID=UPI00058E31D7|nr:sodium/glutamate symporter [Nigerium massiliense]